MTHQTLLIKSQVDNQLKECIYDIQRNGYTSTLRMMQEYQQLCPQKRFCELRAKGFPLMSFARQTENKFNRTVFYKEYTYRFITFGSNDFCIFEGGTYWIFEYVLRVNDGKRIFGQKVQSREHAIFLANKIATKKYFGEKLQKLKTNKYYKDAV